MTDFTGVRRVRYDDYTLRLMWRKAKDRPERIESLADVRTGASNRVIGRLFKHRGEWYVSPVGASEARHLRTFGELHEYLGLGEERAA